MQIVAILTLITFSVYGQKVERIITKYPNSKNVKEVYYVLKSDKNVKHGDYFLFFDGEITTKDLKAKNTSEIVLGIKIKGRFTNNAKEGEWTYFKEPTSNAKLEEGIYTNGKKSGIWEKYIEEGKVIKQFDFDNNTELPEVVRVSLKYPSEARKNNIEGLVRVKITYDSCRAIDYQILNDIGYGCGKAVVEVLKEKQNLEQKYGVEKLKCERSEEIIETRFKLQ